MKKITVLLMTLCMLLCLTGFAAAELDDLIFETDVGCFYQNSNKCIYPSTADKIFIDDYSVDTHVYMRLTVINPSNEAVDFTPACYVNDQHYTFDPYIIAPDSYPSFYARHDLNSVGEYEAKWYIGDREVAVHSVEVCDGTSDFFNLLHSYMTLDTGMCIWNDVTSQCVRDNLSFGYLSQLSETEIYAPYLRVTNDSSDETPLMYVAFWVNDSYVYWSNQVLLKDRSVSYIQRPFKQLPGDTEVIMFINGIEVAHCMMRLAE